MNFSEFETIQKLKKSAEEIKRLERDLAKQEKALAENGQLAERLGLDKDPRTQSDRASAEASINTLRIELNAMKARQTELYGALSEGNRSSQ